MTSDGVSPPRDRNAFPYLRVRGDVALIGVSTARATAPFMANGFFMRAAGRRLAKCWMRPADAACFGSS